MSCRRQATSAGWLGPWAIVASPPPAAALNSDTGRVRWCAQCRALEPARFDNNSKLILIPNYT